MKDSPILVKRRRYDVGFRAGALHLASESRSTQNAARVLNIDAERMSRYRFIEAQRSHYPVRLLSDWPRCLQRLLCLEPGLVTSRKSVRTCLVNGVG